ncbi:hypothetical protein AMTRI_Chr08g168910 [Amborella trichopoda]
MFVLSPTKMLLRFLSLKIPRPNSLLFYHFHSRTQIPNKVDLIFSKLKENMGFTSIEKQSILTNLSMVDAQRILLRSQSNPSMALNFFNCIRTEPSLKPSPKNYCVIIHILTWSRSFSQAMELIIELIKTHECQVFENLIQSMDECNWNPVVLDMLIKCYVQLGRIDEGLESFKKVIGFGLVPSINACNSLLNGLLRSNAINTCWDIYEEMGRVGIPPNSYTLNILTHALCRKGDFDRVTEFLERMEEREGLDLDLVTYNTLIDGYCKRDKLGDALYLYKIMYRRGVAPNLVSYTILITGLCKEHRVRKAHQLFHRMVHRGIAPDKFIYNSLICGYCKEGEMKKSRALLNEMIHSGLEPDDFTCRSFIEGYKRGKKLISALKLVLWLRKLCVPISSEIDTSLMASLCIYNRPNVAKSFLRRIIEDGFEPGLPIYNFLIKSLCENNYVTEAVVVREEMMGRGIKPDFYTYQTLICSLCKGGRLLEGEELMREMVESGLVPSSMICGALVSGYCKSRELDKAEMVLCYFSGNFQMPSVESYNEIIGAHIKNKDVKKAFQMHDEMLKLGLIPNCQSCKLLITGLSSRKR